LLQSVGFTIPEGDVATTVQESKEIAKRIGKPVLVKAQVWVSGRFKAGASNSHRIPRKPRKVAGMILGAEIKGSKVEKVLIEEQLNIDKEYYMSIIIDDSYKVRAPIVLSVLKVVWTLNK